ncbi:MAG: carbohydrate ABC transporter permease [Ruminococcaceae bacterium]|nr:carbohydrate ABC transporter permease [Oscillospiraceae bacterium]
MYNKSLGSKVFDGFNIAFMILVAVITLYPLWFVLVASLSSNSEVLKSGGLMFWVKDFNVNAYKAVLFNSAIWNGYKNTIIVVIAGTALNILLTAIGGYFMSRKGVMLKPFISIAIIFTMYFSGGTIPFYFTVRALHINDSLLSLILPVAINTYNMIIMQTAFLGIPDSLEEAAKIDGARHSRILFSIMLPICMPTIAVLILYYGVSHWNSWFNAMIFIRNRELFPLQLILREIVITNTIVEGSNDFGYESVGETIQYATMVVATLPVLLVYPFMQKYFVGGMMIGAVKG